MDSRMLEVAIGLALVFALFGLLITAIQEGLAQAMKSRGKTLRLAVTSLMGDDATMADALMKHPLLVSMAEGDENSRLRPSYLSADVFVSALIGFLTTNHLHGDKPVTPAEFVTRLGTTLPPNLTDSLKTLLAGAETDWPAFEQRLCAWYDAVSERATGWYKRKTQRNMLIVGTIVAAVLNINPIVIGPRLWDDDPLRKSLVTAGEQASKAYADELAKGTAGDPAAVAAAAANMAASAAVVSLNSQPLTVTGASLKVPATERSGEVEAQLAQLKQRLDRAATATVGRASGNSTGPLLQALGRLDRLVHALDDARLVGDGSLERQRKSVQGRLALDAELSALRTLAASAAARALGDDLPDQVDRLKKAIDDELKERQGPPASLDRKPPGACDKASSAEARAICQRMNDLNALQLAGLPVGWSPPYLPNVVRAKSCNRVDWTQSRLTRHGAEVNEQLEQSPPDYCAGLGLLINPNIWFALFGWLLTGLAGTLGATFWFDLLTRFVRLRGAGGKPESSTTKTETSTGTGAATPGPESPGGVMTRPAAPAPVPRPPASSDVLNAAEAALTTAEVEEIQRRLQVNVTGYFNQATRDAVAQRQRTQHLAETGELTATQIIELLGRAPSSDGDGFVG